MKITEIKKQQKGKDRFNIFIDGNFAFGLYKDTIADFGLRVNDDLSETRISEIKEIDEFNFGKKAAFDFLSYRQRSRKEVYDKLKLKKISEHTISKILLFLENLNYVDDRVFTKSFIASAASGKPSGKKLILQKLLKKGIDKNLAESILNENYNEMTEYENAKILLLKYLPKIRQKENYEIKKKCFAYLASRGFDYETINILLNSELNK